MTRYIKVVSPTLYYSSLAIVSTIIMIAALIGAAKMIKTFYAP